MQLDRSSSASRPCKSDRPSSSLRAAPLSSPQPSNQRNPTQIRSVFYMIGNPQTPAGHLRLASQLFSDTQSCTHLVCRRLLAGSPLTLLRDRVLPASPAAANRRQILTRAPQAPRPAGRTSRPRRPGLPALSAGPARRAVPALAPHGAAAGGAGGKCGAEPSAASRPDCCGREYTDWIQRGSGRGRRGSRASKHRSCYKMLLTIKGR